MGTVKQLILKAFNHAEFVKNSELPGALPPGPPPGLCPGPAGGLTAPPRPQAVFTEGTGQGRILAPFMYKVYINALLIALSNYAYALNINSLSLPSPSFADYISLLAIQPSFLRVLMQMCYCYSLTWRYEFNNSKSGVVTFDETNAVHCYSMTRREWILGGEIVDELYEYNNLGVLKNYIGSFSSNVNNNIEKTRSKAGMIFPFNLDRFLVWVTLCRNRSFLSAHLFFNSFITHS